MVSDAMFSGQVPARDVDLSRHNTLALKAVADVAIDVTDSAQLPSLFAFATERGLPWWVLGGGSNVILPARLHGIVLLMRTRGITQLSGNAREDDQVDISVAAGENWDDVVAHCVANRWHGLENLSLIPGSCGAAPVQNIGAYGVEVAQFITAVDYFDVRTQCFATLDNAGCEFSYRDSIFKHALRGRVIITGVQLRLHRMARVNLEYPALRAQFAAGVSPTPAQVRDAVIALRRSKLPDPAQLPNVGSFFKNPIIPHAQFLALQQQDSRLVHYPQADGSVKLAAGYLIDQCGWKGRDDGRVRVHDQQALVLINRGGAAARDMLHTAAAIRADVAARYGVTLEIEPDVVGQEP
jgi:UDP-N-acetylmuramate dehydrogenase